MVHLIKYELKGYRPRAAYQAIEDTIKSMGPWCHIPESTWLLETSLSTRQVAERLAPLTLLGDPIFVTRIYDDWWSYSLSQEQINWLKTREFRSPVEIFAQALPLPKLPLAPLLRSLVR